MLAWAEVRRGDRAAGQRRFAALKAAAESYQLTFDLLSTEAYIAEAIGDWRHAIEVRRRTIAMASEWKLAALVMEERLGLARALHGAGESRERDALVAELIPQVEQLGLRRVARDLRALSAAPVVASR